ncbi:RND efflux system, inner membrane transporter CmeB [Klebsiella aerogenes]|nr:RND efflux system, inner membrane transporter CmeB [Klebsiella aerogenes]
MIQTLFEAIILVVCRDVSVPAELPATLIPAVAVPVVLLGTFGVLALFGYSINTLTLFAMVLAIGLLVDDAIVVGKTSRHYARRRAPRPRSHRKIDGESPGALVAIALVLSAVFLPMAFFGGSTGSSIASFGNHYFGNDAVGGGGANPHPGAGRRRCSATQTTHQRVLGAFNRLWGARKQAYQRRRTRRPAPGA